MLGPILLTGGTGFVGSHVADHLANRGYAVRALVRRSSDLRHLASVPGVELCEGDLEDLPSLLRAVRGVEGVVHLAGLTTAPRHSDYHRVNAQGTANLLDALGRAEKPIRRFVHVSSLAAAGPSRDGRPVGPGAAAPVSAYGHSKLAAERLVIAAAAAFTTVVLRPPVVHGPRDRATLLLYRAIKRGFLAFPLSPRTIVSTVYVSDLAAACHAALEAPVPSGTTFELEDGQPRTVGELVEVAEAAMGRKVRIRLSVPGPVLSLAAWTGDALSILTGMTNRLPRDKLAELSACHWICSSGRARDALGWTPRTDFPEGAQRAVHWYRKVGWL